ncbi:DUF3291 domain-containing protein [Actinoplanes sp. NPDC023801]|uniref:DUF3291 domain-containing protein n=1 Tax=Actinoplanes sp. NPDC023801 TaxID=3154595 RepID=UPI0034071CB0
MTFHLAQMNVAKLRAPEGDPLVAEFTAGVDLMNELADRSPGFIWRLKEEDVDLEALGIQPAAPDMIATMSVWESLEALRGYVYQSAHLDYLRRRREWFVAGGSAMVLWWVEAGRIPTLRDGLQRLALLGAQGPGPQAFTFRQTFPAPVLSRP